MAYKPNRRSAKKVRTSTWERELADQVDLEPHLASAVLHKLYSFSPSHLFPFGRAYRPTSPLTPCSSVALSGLLPHSSVLHIALHHLNEQPAVSSQTTAPAPLSPPQEVGEEDRERRVLILTSDQTALREALAAEQDVSLIGGRREAMMARLLDRIDIKHLPTSAHLTYFLATIYTHQSPPSAREAFVATGARSTVDPSYLPFPPTLVILHNSSEYLAEDSALKAGLEAFGSLLAHFTSTFTSLAPSSPPLLVLHDRSAKSLSLPVIAPHLSRPRKRRRGGGSSSDEEAGPVLEEKDSDKLPLEEIIAHFFDWIGEAERLVSSPHTADGESQKKFWLAFAPSKRRLPNDIRQVDLEYTVTESNKAEEEGVRIELVE